MNVHRKLIKWGAYWRLAAELLTSKYTSLSGLKVSFTRWKVAFTCGTECRIRTRMLGWSILKFACAKFYDYDRPGVESGKVEEVVWRRRR